MAYSLSLRCVPLLPTATIKGCGKPEESFRKFLFILDGSPISFLYHGKSFCQ